MKTLAFDLVGGLAPEFPEMKEDFVRNENGLEKLLDHYNNVYRPLIELSAQDVVDVEEADLHIPSVSNQDLQTFLDFCSAPSNKKEEQRYFLGEYLSLLFNHSYEKRLTINVEKGQLLDGLGAQFGKGTAKKLTINGDVGRKLGVYMHKGTIIVNGSADRFVGEEMNGGLIIIKKSHMHRISHECMFTCCCRNCAHQRKRARYRLLSARRTNNH